MNLFKNIKYFFEIFSRNLEEERKKNEEEEEKKRKEREEFILEASRIRYE